MSGSDVCISSFFTSSISDAVGDESCLLLLIKILFRGLEELLHNFSSLISFSRDSETIGSTSDVVSLGVGLRLNKISNFIYAQSGDF